MNARFDMSDPERSEEALSAATLAVRRGELVVMPTDTVYGLAADAFDPEAVQRLLDAKGRGRDMPPPVLVSAPSTLDALVDHVNPWTRALVDEFWPGPLTLVCTAQPSLQWDLGDTRGTVAVRMPDDEVALDLLRRTGPLAVSSANLSGRPAATDAGQADEMLGSSVTLILDGGPSTSDAPSTIIDCTGTSARVLREGALPLAGIREVLEAAGGSLEPAEGESDPEPSAVEESEPDSGSDSRPDSGSDSGPAVHTETSAEFDSLEAGDQPGA